MANVDRSTESSSVTRRNGDEGGGRRAERALRRIAVGRKAWLFVGSDDHAQAAGNPLTLIASARLHGLDPEAYVREWALQVL